MKIINNEILKMKENDNEILMSVMKMKMKKMIWKY